MRKLPHRITIYRPNASQDAAGQPIEDSEIVAGEVPAAFTATGGGEQLRGRQVHADARGVFTCRYVSDVMRHSPEGRTELHVVWQENTYYILRASDPDGRRREMQLDVAEVL